MGFAKATCLSLRLPEKFSQIGFPPNKTQCALYSFDPESGESQQSWLSYIVKFWICSNLTLPGNPFKLKPEKGFAQTLSCPFCQVSHCSNVSLPSVYSHRGQTEYPHESLMRDLACHNLDILLSPPGPKTQSLYSALVSIKILCMFSNNGVIFKGLNFYSMMVLMVLGRKCHLKQAGSLFTVATLRQRVMTNGKM